MFLETFFPDWYPTFTYMASRKPTQAPAAAVSGPSSAVALRPVASVRRIALFEREVRERLSKAALDLIFERAEVISEGGSSGRDAYCGSTMLTIDLAALAPALREPCDAGTARRLAALLAIDADAAARVRAIAAAEAARVSGAPHAAVTAEIKVNARGACVLIDVDVEAAR